MMSSVRRFIPKRDGSKSPSQEQGELQTMLPSAVTVHKTDGPKQEGVCLMTESPFRILRVSK